MVVCKKISIVQLKYKRNKHQEKKESQRKNSLELIKGKKREEKTLIFLSKQRKYEENTNIFLLSFLDKKERLMKFFNCNFYIFINKQLFLNCKSLTFENVFVIEYLGKIGYNFRTILEE